MGEENMNCQCTLDEEKFLNDKIKEEYVYWVKNVVFQRDSLDIIQAHITAVEQYMKMHNLDYVSMCSDIYNILYREETRGKLGSRAIVMILRTYREFINKNNKKINEILRRVVETHKTSDNKLIIQPVTQHADSIKGLDLKSEYRKWLIVHGYKELTPSGYPSTIPQYINSIEIVKMKECFDNWIDVCDNIDRLVIDYSLGGREEKYGLSGHRTPINALHRFKEFIDFCRCK